MPFFHTDPYPSVVYPTQIDEGYDLPGKRYNLFDKDKGRVLAFLVNRTQFVIEEVNYLSS